MLTYEAAVAMLKGRQSKNLRYAEKLVRFSPNAVAVTRHGHPMVIIYDSGLWTLDSCGYRTVTTKKTINTYAPVSVYQKGLQWFLWAPNNEIAVQSPGEFFDGVTVNADGEVQNKLAAV